MHTDFNFALNIRKPRASMAILSQRVVPLDTGDRTQHGEALELQQALRGLELGYGVFGFATHLRRCRRLPQVGHQVARQFYPQSSGERRVVSRGTDS